MAGGPMLGANSSERGRFHFATRQCIRTTRVKNTAGWRLEQQGGITFDTAEDILLFQGGQAGHQQLTIGMLGLGKKCPDRPFLRQLAGIHDPDAAGKLRHQPHIMANQNYCRA